MVPDASSRPKAPSANPLRRRVWSAGRLLVLVLALAVTYGVFFLASMRVATRAREVRVPDLRGKSLADASGALSASGLALHLDPVRTADALVPADRVLSQDPGPGTIVRRQRAVRIRVSDGIRAPVVPAVVGLSERAAEITLAQEHVQVAARAEVHSYDYPPGVVVAQDPPAKSRTTTVALLVNRAQGGIPYVMPDLIGTPADRTMALLREQSFRVAISGEVAYPGLPPGIVVWQSPQAGYRLTSVQAITLEITK